MRRDAVVHAVAILGATLVGLAACTAFLLAGVVETQDCGEGYRMSCQQGLVTLQIVVASLGLLPAWALVWTVSRRRWRLSVALLLVTMVIYLAWGVLNDAAVHGWDDLKVF